MGREHDGSDVENFALVQLHLVFFDQSIVLVVHCEIRDHILVPKNLDPSYFFIFSISSVTLTSVSSFRRKRNL